MDVSLQANEFVRKVLGVPVLFHPYQVKHAAIDLIFYLYPRPTVERWVIIIYNPDLRATLIALLLYLNRGDDDLDWSILFTKLEQELDELIREAMGKDIVNDIFHARNQQEVIDIYHEAFRLIGRDAASKFTQDLLAYVISRKQLVRKIKQLATS